MVQRKGTRTNKMQKLPAKQSSFWVTCFVVHRHSQDKAVEKKAKQQWRTTSSHALVECFACCEPKFDRLRCFFIFFLCKVHRTAL